MANSARAAGPPCSIDGIQNGTETGIDCGGNCPACPTCTDGIQNGTETGVDCGGSCAACTGETCAKAIAITSLPYTATGLTTCGSGDDYGDASSCTSVYMTGDDYVFSYTPSVNEIIKIELANTGDWTGLFLLDGCPDIGGTTCMFKQVLATGQPKICAVSVTSGITYYIIVSTWAAPQCTPFDIAVTGAPTSCSLDYSDASIAYAPEDYATGTDITANLTASNRFATTYVSIGFNFNFDGRIYDELLVSPHSHVVFCCSTVPNGGDGIPGGTSINRIFDAAPSTFFVPMNTIMAPWHDLAPGSGGNIRHETTGTAPDRKFTVKYDAVPMSGCTGDASKHYSGQIMLYETTNVIEVHIGNSQSCIPTFNAGLSILGLHNISGSAAVIPTGHNYPTIWTETNTAYRFTPNCSGDGAVCVASVLPIELLSFSGINTGDVNLLKWETASETNNDYFTVERSIDGESFNSIGTVPGAGHSNTRLSYRLADKNILHQGEQLLYYYRLKQTDYDGKFAYSEIIAVKRQKHNGLIVGELYPNPACEYVHFSYTSKENQPLKVEVYGSMGKEISKIYDGLELSPQIDIRDLKDGIYIVKIAQQSWQTTRKLLVIKGAESF